MRIRKGPSGAPNSAGTGGEKCSSLVQGPAFSFSRLLSCLQPSPSLLPCGFKPFMRVFVNQVGGTARKGLWPTTHAVSGILGVGSIHGSRTVSGETMTGYARTSLTNTVTVVRTAGSEEREPEVAATVS